MSTYTRDEVAYLMTRHFGLTWADPAVAVAIVMAESGGDSDARRDASRNPGGGNDRGWWQLNDTAHPDLSDGDAYNPTTATRYAHQLSQAGADFSCWGYRFSPRKVTAERCPNYRADRQRTDLDIGGARTAVDKVRTISSTDPIALAALGKLTSRGAPAGREPRGGLDLPGPIDIPNPADVIPGLPNVPGLGTIADLIGTATTALRALTTPAWWRRIGIGVLGAILLLVFVQLAAARS